MKIDVTLENSENKEILFTGKAEVETTPANGMIISMPNYVWKILKEGIVLISREEGEVSVILRRKGPSKAVIKLPGLEISLPVIHPQCKRSQEGLEVSYTMEDSAEIFRFLLKIPRDLETPSEPL